MVDEGEGCPLHGVQVGRGDAFKLDEVYRDVGRLGESNYEDRLAKTK